MATAKRAAKAPVSKTTVKVTTSKTAPKALPKVSQALMRKLNEDMVSAVNNNTCLGNSDRELKDLVQDLLNECCSCDADYARIADRAWLKTVTVIRVSNQDKEDDYQPRADTLQRLMQAMDVQLIASHQKVNRKYLPTTKRPDLEDV